MAKNNGGLTRRIRHFTAYVLFWTFCLCVGLLPRRAAELGGRAFGWLFWRVSAKRRRRAEQNIESAMAGELTKDETARLAKQSFIHIGLTVAETLWWYKRVGKGGAIAKDFPLEGLGPMKAELAAGRGVIAVTLHLGNWELLGARLAEELGGLTAVALPGKNQRVDDYVVRIRERMGVSVARSDRGVRPMVATLRNGKALAVLIDRHVETASVHVKFFGRDAATTSIVAALARRLDVPVVVGYSVREGYSFKHHGFCEGPVELVRTGDRDSDILVNTQRLNDRLEAAVRKHPEQWLWVLKRWRLARKLERERRGQTAADDAAPAAKDGED